MSKNLCKRVKKEKDMEYTKDEVLDMFMEYMSDMIDYWDNTDNGSREKLKGLVHSILTVIDGEAADLPAFMLIPLPHKDDKEYQLSQNEKYYPEVSEEVIKSNPCDIAGSLHEILYNYTSK